MSALRRWFDRVFFLYWLRAHMPVHVLRRGFATLYAVACSREELAELECIDRTQIARLAAGVQHYLDLKTRIPSAGVLCIGSGADLTQASGGPLPWLSEPFGLGIWRREIRLAVARFGQGTPMRQIVVHELTHALLDLLTRGFPYPIAVAEGFARRTEYLLPYENGETEWTKHPSGHAAAGRSCWHPEHLMSVWELLNFDVMGHWRKDMRAFLIMTQLSFWLNIYLFKLSELHPAAKTILAALRLGDIRTPAGVYRWMQEVLHMRADELEEGFRRFCITGSVGE